MTHGEVEVLAGEIDVLERGGQLEHDRRMLLGKAAEPVHQPLAGEIGRRADRERAGLVLLQQGFGAERQLVEGVTHHGEIAAPGGGDDEAAMFAVEQPAAELGFERLHLLADRALRDAQFLRGLGEALMPRRGLAGLQRIQGRQAADHAGRLPCMSLSRPRSRNDGLCLWHFASNDRGQQANAP